MVGGNAMLMTLLEMQVYEYNRFYRERRETAQQHRHERHLSAAEHPTLGTGDSRPCRMVSRESYQTLSADCGNGGNHCVRTREHGADW